MRYVCLVALALAVPACGGHRDGVDTVDWCDRDGGPVDVVVFDNKTFANVCYNPLVDVTLVTDPAEPFPQTGTGATVTFEGATNGHAITGDVTVDGDFVTIYGNGADNSIIDGNVTVTGNNARIRGVTIRGTLTFQDSNGSILSSRVGGDVVIADEATLVSEDDVFGSVTASTTHNLYVDDRVQGDWSPGGKATCAGNASFTDTDSDGVAQDAEVTGDLSC